MFATLPLILLLSILNPSSGAIIRKSFGAKIKHYNPEGLQEVVQQSSHDDAVEPRQHLQPRYKLKSLQFKLQKVDSPSKYDDKTHLYEDRNSVLNTDNSGAVNSLVKAIDREIELASVNDKLKGNNKVAVLKGVEIDGVKNLKEIVDVLSKQAVDNNKEELPRESSKYNLPKKYEGFSFIRPALRINDRQPDVTLNEMITTFETLKDQAMDVFNNYVVGSSDIKDILKYLPKDEKDTMLQVHKAFHSGKQKLSTNDIAKGPLTAEAVEKEVRKILYGDAKENIIRPSSDKNQNIIFVPKAVYKSILDARDLYGDTTPDKLYKQRTPLKFKKLIH